MVRVHYYMDKGYTREAALAIVAFNSLMDASIPYDQLPWDIIKEAQSSERLAFKDIIEAIHQAEFLQ